MYPEEHEVQVRACLNMANSPDEGSEETITQRSVVDCVFVHLGNVLRPVNTPCGTSYIRHVFQMNEGMMPYLL